MQATMKPPAPAVIRDDDLPELKPLVDKVARLEDAAKARRSEVEAEAKAKRPSPNPAAVEAMLAGNTAKADELLLSPPKAATPSAADRLAVAIEALEIARRECEEKRQTVRVRRNRECIPELKSIMRDIGSGLLQAHSGFETLAKFYAARSTASGNGDMRPLPTIIAPPMTTRGLNLAVTEWLNAVLPQLDRLA